MAKLSFDPAKIIWPNHHGVCLFVYSLLFAQVDCERLENAGDCVVQKARRSGLLSQLIPMRYEQSMGQVTSGLEMSLRGDDLAVADLDLAICLGSDLGIVGDDDDGA